MKKEKEKKLGKRAFSQSSHFRLPSEGQVSREERQGRGQPGGEQLLGENATGYVLSPLHL
jgi:hypothetical protein